MPSSCAEANVAIKSMNDENKILPVFMKYSYDVDVLENADTDFVFLTVRVKNANYVSIELSVHSQNA